MTSLAEPSYYPLKTMGIDLIEKAQDNGETLIEKADGERDQTPTTFLTLATAKWRKSPPITNL